MPPKRKYKKRANRATNVATNKTNVTVNVNTPKPRAYKPRFRRPTQQQTRYEGNPYNNLVRQVNTPYDNTAYVAELFNKITSNAIHSIDRSGRQPLAIQNQPNNPSNSTVDGTVFSIDTTGRPTQTSMLQNEPVNQPLNFRNLTAPEPLSRQSSSRSGIKQSLPESNFAFGSQEMSPLTTPPKSFRQQSEEAAKKMMQNLSDKFTSNNLTRTESDYSEFQDSVAGDEESISSIRSSLRSAPPPPPPPPFESQPPLPPGPPPKVTVREFAKLERARLVQGRSAINMVRAQLLDLDTNDSNKKGYAESRARKIKRIEDLYKEYDIEPEEIPPPPVVEVKRSGRKSTKKM